MLFHVEFHNSFGSAHCIPVKLVRGVCVCVCVCALRRFIQYCEEEGGYTGFDYSDAEGEEDVVTRLAALNINLESDGRCFKAKGWVFHYSHPSSVRVLDHPLCHSKLNNDEIIIMSIWEWDSCQLVMLI